MSLTTLAWWGAGSCLALWINGLLGSVVWALIDDEEERLYQWFNDCPSKWVMVGILELWPVAVLAVLLGERKGGSW